MRPQDHASLRVTALFLGRDGAMRPANAGTPRAMVVGRNCGPGKEPVCGVARRRRVVMDTASCSRLAAGPPRRNPAHAEFSDRA